LIRRINLALYQGDDWAGMVTVTNADGTPADLTEYTAQSQIRSGTADQTWRVAAQLECTVIEPNLISILLTNEQTTLLREPAYFWDLQVISPDGQVSTLIAGDVAVTHEITRRLPDPVARVLSEVLL
jgi:hypothetical protein